MILKPNCECCDADLPAEQGGAVVCSFECTFCTACAEQLLGYSCPNCGGELSARPRRAQARLAEAPASEQRVNKAHRARDYRQSEVSVRTATGELWGSLLLPPKRPKAWVLLIAGSGPSDRDGNTAGQPYRHNCLRYLALALAAQGIASLRYDKRGVGASAAAGSEQAALSFEHFIDDAKDWLALLRLRASGPVSIIGHSEGAQIATRVAEKLSVASVVNLCGAGRPLHDLLLAQLQPVLSAPLYAQAQTLLSYLYELSLPQQQRPPTRASLLQRLHHKAHKAPDIPPQLYSLFSPDKHPFYVSRMRERPDRELETLTCPVCIISAGSDQQVTAEDYQRLCAVKPEARALRIDGMSHVLKQVGDNAALHSRSYVDPALPIDPQLIAELSDFLLT